MGDEEPIELRLWLLFLRSLDLLSMIKVSTHSAAMAKKPSTTITAMAHRGKESPSLPDRPAVPPEVLVAIGDVPERDAVADADAAEAEDRDARDADDIDASTEDGYVVWTALNRDWVCWVPSGVRVEGVITK